jgi:hypothetical protein
LIYSNDEEADVGIDRAGENKAEDAALVDGGDNDNEEEEAETETEDEDEDDEEDEEAGRFMV